MELSFCWYGKDDPVKIQYNGLIPSRYSSVILDKNAYKNLFITE